MSFDVGGIPSGVDMNAVRIFVLLGSLGGSDSVDQTGGHDGKGLMLNKARGTP
jgi:hypothetical protein